MVIITNRIKPSINKENLNRDFDIFKLTKDGKRDFYKNNVLDIPKINFKAVSVVYTWGNEWYAMFKKNEVDKKILKEAINEESPDTRVEKLDLNTDKIYPNVLTLLVLNSLHISKTEGNYNNLTGKLYFFNDKWFQRDKNKKLKGFYNLEISLNNDMDVTLKVQTFGRLSYFNDNKLQAKPKFIFDSITGDFRKKLKEDKINDDEIFIQKSTYSKKHNTIKFLDFSDFKKFKRCKVGIYESFLEDVEYYLGEYIKIDNCTVHEYKTYKKTKDDFENTNYSKLLFEKQIVIVDELQDDNSKLLVSIIKDILEKEHNIFIKEKSKIDRESYNLRVIHNAEYYQNNNLIDLHNINDKNMVIQHITLESFINEKNTIEVEKAAIKKIVQEIIIKGDIHKKSISLVNWEKCNFEDSWTFVRRQKVLLEDKKKKFIYCKMKILNNGKFDIEVYDDSIEKQLNWEWNAIIDAYDSEKYKYEDDIEGLFYKDYQNINRIYRTDQNTMPNFKELRKALEFSDSDKKILVGDIIKCFENFKSDDEIVIKRKNEFIAAIEKFPTYETIKNINKEINIKSTVGKILNKHIYNETGILINSELRKEENRERLLNSLLDIKYYGEENSIYYFVGHDKNIKLSLNNACVIRKVVADEEIEFDNVAKLLTVEFVKSGQYTVVPFPFKYLNEILALR